MLHNMQKLVPILILLATVGLVSPGVASSQENNANDKTSGVPMPRPRTPEGKKCVEPTDIIRKQHMEFILHQRDDTMRRGIRTSKYSLKNCVDCHADPVTKSVLGKDGFCESCHSYAAVSIDCFSCHTDKATDKKSIRSGIGALGSSIISGTGGVK